MDTEFYVKILTKNSIKWGALVEKIGNNNLIMIRSIKAS